MATRLILAPESEPVTLAEVKLQLRVTHDQDDARIEGYITSAREQCEHVLGRSILEQTWEQVLSAFPCSAIKLLWPPIIAVTSIKYIDAATANEITLPSNQYYVDTHSEPGLVTKAQGVSWPATLSVSNAVRVQYMAGYANAAAVPASIKSWIILAVKHMYDCCDSGEQAFDVPDGFYGGLLDRFRTWSM